MDDDIVVCWGGGWWLCFWSWSIVPLQAGDAHYNPTVVSDAPTVAVMTASSWVNWEKHQGIMLAVNVSAIHRLVQATANVATCQLHIICLLADVHSRRWRGQGWCYYSTSGGISSIYTTFWCIKSHCFLFFFRETCGYFRAFLLQPQNGNYSQEVGASTSVIKVTKAGIFKDEPWYSPDPNQEVSVPKPKQRIWISLWQERNIKFNWNRRRVQS